jgi:2-methylcitrate dehydratase PrpD
MEVTAILAKFTTDLHYEKIPRKAVETAKIALRDCLGVALAGSREEDARIAAEIARQERRARRQA